MRQLVALAVPGGPLFVDELRRTWDNGDAAFPVDLRLPIHLQRQAAGSAGASLLIDEHGVHHLDGGFPTEDGDAVVVATSGTTGGFKAAVLTHGALDASARITSDALGVTNGDHWLACLPLSHIGGLSVITRALLTDTRLSVIPRFDALAVGASEATLVALVDATLHRIDTTRFRSILLGGGPAPQRTPPNAIVTYGMTETASGVVYNGRPLNGVELRIGESGLIELRSPTLLRCYRDGRVPLDEAGWFKTGDTGEINDNDGLRVFGRVDDMIITGGEKVWPELVEAEINKHGSVRSVLVHGIPDVEWGSRVVASVELENEVPQPSLEELRDLVKESLPGYCAPRELRIVKMLERTSSGKLLRKPSSLP